MLRPRFASTSVAWALALAFLSGACKREPEPERTNTAPLPTSTAPEPPPQPGTGGRPALPAVEITGEDPATWKKPPPTNAMRKANYVVPRAEGDADDGELVVFYFGPGEGGDIEANVDRWIKQFADIEPGDVKRADRSAHGLSQHTVEIASGTYSSGMPGGPQTPKKDLRRAAITSSSSRGRKPPSTRRGTTSTPSSTA
jgi:hypothetical protein